MYRGGSSARPRADRADGGGRRDPGPLPADAARQVPPRRHHRASSTRRPSSFIRSQGAEPSFKGYRGFPGSICASPNSMVVHGIPGPYELQARRHPLARRRRHQGRLGRRRARSPSRSATGQRRGRASCSRRPSASLFAGIAAGAARQPPRRHLRARSSARSSSRASRSSAPWSATGSAATCTRTRRSPTSASPARARSWRRAWCWRSSRWSTPAAPRSAMGDDGWAVYSAGRLAGRPLRVHGRRHRGRPPHPHPLARGDLGAAARRGPAQRDCCLIHAVRAAPG